MESGESKLDKELKQALDQLTDTEEIDVLLFPKYMDREFESFLQTQKNKGLLDYSILQLANCVVIKATKKVILEIAARAEVSRISINPRFTTNQAGANK